VFVEVYAVEAANNLHPEYEVNQKKLKKENKGGLLHVFTPSKKKERKDTPSRDTVVRIRKPSFGLIGRVTLDEGVISLEKQVHYLDNYFNESPLDGRIMMKVQLNMPPRVSHCGMLRLKDTNGIFGGVDFIKSFFAAIEGTNVNLWNDMREAETEEPPLKSFDLSQAVNSVKVERSFNFFYFPLQLRDLTLQFLTYSEEESNIWCDKLNACITRLSKRY